MDTQQLLMLAIQVSIFLTVFGFGLEATGADVLSLLRRPVTLTRSLLAMFVIMPIVAVLVTEAFEFHDAVEIALVALALSPVPPLLPRREAKAGGRASYGLGLMAVAALLSIVFIPLALYLLGLWLGEPLAIAPGAVMRLALLSVIVPLGAGMVFRTVAPGAAARIAKPAGIVSLVMLAAGALAVAAAVLPAALTLVGKGTILVMAGFAAVGLAVGHFLGGPDRDERVVLALSTSCRHPAIALAIATANYPQEHRVVGALLLYLIVNVLVGIPYLARQRQAAARSGPAIQA